ncbi:hypothetical protein M5689_013206 [Euphorbia peplus]|nr:hypothetical protein M5689_013206 [Euphorbia peplus]
MRKREAEKRRRNQTEASNMNSGLNSKGEKNKSVEIRVGDFIIHVECAATLLILPSSFRGDVTREKVEEKPSESSGVTIKASAENRTKRVYFDKPTPKMTRHIRPLYVKAHIDGKPLSRVLIDNGSAVNIIPLKMVMALGKSEEDIVSSEISVSAFTREVAKTYGVLSVELTISTKTARTAFFVVNSSASYQALLRRDWIHSNACIPSSLHQLMLF